MDCLLGKKYLYSTHTPVCRLCAPLRGVQHGPLPEMSQGHVDKAFTGKRTKFSLDRGAHLQTEELLRRIAADQRLLIQWGDEKMSLACIAVDLVDLHMQQLDRDLASLNAEIEVSQSCLRSADCTPLWTLSHAA